MYVFCKRIFVGRFCVEHAPRTYATHEAQERMKLEQLTNFDALKQKKRREREEKERVLKENNDSECDEDEDYDDQEAHY